MNVIPNAGSTPISTPPPIRLATLADLDALVALEQRCFALDRISRRSFRHILTRARAETLVYEDGEGKLRGYVLLLYRLNTSLARIYSIATDPEYRGRGLGEALVRASEQHALEKGASVLRLEIRKDNEASIRMFGKLGYKPFGEYVGYYEDEQDALRFQKRLGVPLDASITRVPFYQQTLDFTCGPASLMMAMKALDPALELDRRLELRLWRESTTIYMTSGHGGCSAHGLALAAHGRGFPVELFLRCDGPMFIDSVRSEEKKAVMRLVQEEQIEETAAAGIPMQCARISARDLQSKFEAGGIPVVLISSYRLYQEKSPHWVVVTGFDERYVYLSDPFVDYEAKKSVTDCINIPILREDFDRMTRYGKSGQEAVVVLYPPKARGG